MKMYVAILEDCPDNMVPVVAAHAVLRHHLFFTKEINQGKPFLKLTDLDIWSVYHNWLEKSFKKCVVRVNEKELNKILAISGAVETSESSVLLGKVCCATIVVGDNVPNVLKFAKLWSPRT